MDFHNGSILTEHDEDFAYRHNLFLHQEACDKALFGNIPPGITVGGFPDLSSGNPGDILVLNPLGTGYILCPRGFDFGAA